MSLASAAGGPALERACAQIEQRALARVEQRALARVQGRQDINEINERATRIGHAILKILGGAPHIDNAALGRIVKRLAKHTTQTETVPTEVKTEPPAPSPS